MIELRSGPWQEALADVDACDALICDPPYSERTHKGAMSGADVRGVTGYASLSAAQAYELVLAWTNRCAGWIVIQTDHMLWPAFDAALRHAGRYTFPPLPVLQQQPRQTGDGPAPYGHLLCVARPRKRRFLSWGSLPGWYEAPRDREFIRGGKPLGLMRAIVRDYSRPGDLVIDPFAGAATTLIASAIEGRRSIGAELDPKTHAKAMRRIARGYTPAIVIGERSPQKQKTLDLSSGRK